MVWRVELTATAAKQLGKLDKAQARRQLIDESLDFYGIKSRQDARDLVRRARGHAGLTAVQSQEVVQEQIRAVRRR